MNNLAVYAVYTGSVTGTNVKMNRKHSMLLDENGKPIYYFRDGDGGSGGILGQVGYSDGRAEKMKIPSKIKAQWFCYEENQFYEGEFDLPEDLIKERFYDKSIALFDTDHRNRPLNEEIVITFAPKGKMYVYLTGYTRKLIGSFQGKPINYDWKQWLLDNAGFPEEIVAINKGERKFYSPSGAEFPIQTREEFVQEVNGLASTKADLARQYKFYNEGFFKPVKWTLKTKGQIDEILGIAVNKINGEEEVIQDKSRLKEKLVFNSIPIYIVIDFVYKGKPLRYSIDFDNNRYDYDYLYKRYYENFNPNENVEVILDFVKVDYVDIYFKQGSKSLLIEDLHIFELDR